MSFNKITICGYLGRDPELRYVGEGNAVCNFSVATTEKVKGEQYTTWFRVVAWGRLAEMCKERLTKGSLAYVDGRLRMEEYTDRDGNKCASLEVNASDVRFLDRRGDGETSTKREAQEAAHEFQQNPTGNFNPRPNTLADLVTPKQLWMIRNTAREIGVDAEDFCRREFTCPLEEISKRAASMLIEKIKGGKSEGDSVPF